MGLHVAEGRVAYAAAYSLPVHPLQIYLALLAIGVGCFLLWYRRRARFEGQLFLLFLVLHEAGKAFLEPLRPLGLGGRHLAFASLGVAIAAAIAEVGTATWTARDRALAASPRLDSRG